MTNNSASPLLAQSISSQLDNLKLLTEITKSSQDNIESTEIVFNGETIKIPSYGYLKAEIDRINKNIEILSGWEGNGEVSLKNSIGEFKTIYSVDGSIQPSKINGLATPENFKYDNNWFFESFLNPLLSIQIDITSVTDNHIASISSKRFILEDTPEANAWFDLNYLGKNNIDFTYLINDLYKNNIRWSVDEQIININPVELSIYGNFSVIDWKDNASNVKEYYLNTIKYFDSNGNAINLAIGDTIISGKSTKWKITSVDSSNNIITLSKLSGWEPISIGTDTLKIWNNNEGSRIVNIPLGYNEREFIFFKAINKHTNIISNEWSTGFAIYTNSLVDTKSGFTLDNFYKKYVTDYSQFFLSIAKEKPISAIDGLIPNTPVLSESNFNVIRVNEHKYSQKEEEDILNKSKQRISLQSEIEQLTISIEKKKQELGSKQYEGNERNKIKTELETLINTKLSKASQYNSLSKELITIGKNSSLAEKSKFKIRGFWGIPEARTDVNNNRQEIIQFLIEYRYVRKDGKNVGAKEMEYIDTKGEKKRGFFSEWISMKSDIRKKIYNDTLGVYEWEVEDTLNPEKININQLDIAISPNESVEIRIKSISEAGWPINPLHSEYSTPILITFPDALNTDSSWETSVQSALDDENRIRFNEELSNRGLDLHLGGSFVKNEKYWAHDSTSISSGFYTPDGNIIALFDKLTSIDLELARIKEIITRAKGSLQVWIYDSKGNKIPVSNNTKVDLFGGYYKEEINSLSLADQKGAIINKVFYIGVKNSAASTLELLSIYPGGMDELLPDSNTVSTLDKYKKYAYEKVPLGIEGLQTNITSTDSKNNLLPYQSSQVPGQWLYFRYNNIGLNTQLYKPADSNIFWHEPNLFGSTTSNFIWNGVASSSTPGYLSEFAIHTSHPAVALNLNFADLQDPYSSGNIKYPEFRHSAYFELESSDVNGVVQLELTKGIALSTGRDKYPAKIGFHVNDRYLIGNKTCGAYFYPAINKRELLSVTGNDSLSTLKIEFGDENEIKVPLLFQYRMQDFFGNETTINEGKIGGWNNTNQYPQNISYKKRLGIDIKVLDEQLFSFDIEISSKYKRDTISEINSNNLEIASLSKNNFTISASSLGKK